MIITYELRAHVRDVRVDITPLPGNTKINRHSGYDMITINEDGTKTIQYIDLYNDNGKIKYYISAPISAMEYTLVETSITGETTTTKITWGQQTFQNGQVIQTNVDYLKDFNVEADIVLDGNEAVEAFNKIKLEAALTNFMNQLDYDIFSWNSRVCNTATNYWGEKYISGFVEKNVFDSLPGNYYGSNDDYIYATGHEQAEKLKFINNLVEQLANQGAINDILTNESPYIADKYLQILQPFLSGDFAYQGSLELLVDCLKDGILTLSDLSLISSANAQELKISETLSQAETVRSPLVLDLDGDGVETRDTGNGVYFDHDGNNFAEKSGWVGSDDGLLVHDVNNNGKIDDGTELFGNNSVLSSGAKAANGFEALAELDSNGDGVFNNSDTAWNNVKVWKDANGNGIVDEGELITLEQANVVGINLNYSENEVTDANGNEHKQTGTFIKTDGTTGSVHDVWFDVDTSNTIDLYQTKRIGYSRRRQDNRRTRTERGAERNRSSFF